MRADERSRPDVDVPLVEDRDRGEADDAALAERAEPPAAAAAGADRAELDHRLPSPLHQLGRAPLQRPADVVDRARRRVVPLQHARRRYFTCERPYPPAMHAPTVETTSGKLIGATHRGTARVPRHPVRRAAGRGASLPSAAAGRAVERCARGAHVRADGAAAAFGARGARRQHPARSERRLLDAQRVDAGMRWSEAAGDGLDPRRWLHDRHRRRALGTAARTSRCRAMSSS